MYDTWGFSLSPAAGLHEVHDPGRHGDVVGGYRLPDESTVEDAVTKGAAAQRLWEAVPVAERWQRLAAVADRLPVDDLARLLVREQGKPLAEALKEMRQLRVVLDMYAPHLDWLAHGEGGEAGTPKVEFSPFGVCAVITPWNWPFRISAALTVPALLAGNAVIVHLAASAPLAAARAFASVAEALPEGLLTVLTHPEPTVAQALTRHPGIRKIAFTGSTGVGRLVMASAAQTLKSVTLELGGNDPAILLEDLEPDEEVARRLVTAAFATSGQVCMAIKRLYVPEAVRQDWVDALSAVLEQEVVGHGLSAGITRGPVHSRAQFERLSGLIDDARAHGARVHTHGQFAVDPSTGWYLLPTLVDEVAPEAAVVAEEQFGPILPVLGYASSDQAVDLANDSPYGLCSSVWSADTERATDIARRIEAGTTWINAHGPSAQDPQAPFGGIKSSGIGRISGRWGIESFVEPHAIVRG